MGWFNGFVKTKHANETIWQQCPSCKKHILIKDWTEGFNVCPKCSFHDKITAPERIQMLIDAGTFKELDTSITPTDPLSFVDKKGSYKEKVEQSREKTGLNESVVTGIGQMNGRDVALGVMDFRFLGGSLASGTGEKILRVATQAYEKGIPLIIISASGGARMHEGILSLMQMAKTCAVISKLNEKKVPYISVMTDPTTGGVSASFATVGDINLAEPGALIGFAGRRVIEETINQKLPDDFQTAEYQLEHGFVDKIVHRRDMKETISQLLSFYNR